jgi:3-dehydroquinate synthase II
MPKEVWVSQELEKLGKELGVTGIRGRSKVGLKTLPENIVEVDLKSQRDIEKLKEHAGEVPYIIADSKDWKVIPAENLVASVQKDSGTKILMKTNEPEEAKAFLHALELGVDGVYVDKDTKLKEICSILEPIPGLIKLVNAEVKKVVVGSGLGVRACIDFVDYLCPHEGILIGSSSNFLFLTDSETLENPWVEPRPFRVNAGYVHSYALSGHQKTKYLSELKGGNTLPVINYKGETRLVQIGRVKIERRLPVKIVAEYKGIEGHIFSQYAETVRLVSSDGSVSTKEVKPGDLVKAYVNEKSGGMHFGTFVKGEFILEK